MKKSGMSGFTLLELIIVMVILGILLSLATVSMADYINRTKLRTTVNSINTDIRRARWLALSSSKTFFVNFNTLENSYTLNGALQTLLPAGIRFGASHDVTGCPGAPATLPPADGISFDSPGNPNTLIYYASGEVVPAGTVYVTDGQHTMAVRVSNIGRPRVWRSNGGSSWTAY